MSKFNRPSKANLRNAQHFEFIRAFLTVLDDSNFRATKIQEDTARLATAFQEEDRWFMIARASELKSQRLVADRTNCFSRLQMLARLWAGSGAEEKDEAATRLMRVFKVYNLKTNAQIDEKTGHLANLIDDLSTEPMQADISTIGGTWLFDEMVVAHQQVLTMRMEEGVEMSRTVRGALVAARKRCDEVYDELTYMIEAFAVAADDATPYEEFINRWNGSLKLYQDSIERKGRGELKVEDCEEHAKPE